MRHALIALSLLFGVITSATAQMSAGIGLPGVRIGINLPVYPQLVRVRGYPVYDAPRVNSNYFFSDGMYWVYRQDNWYAGAWYNGPWGVVVPEAVPVFHLQPQLHDRKYKYRPHEVVVQQHDQAQRAQQGPKAQGKGSALDLPQGREKSRDQDERRDGERNQ